MSASTRSKRVNSARAFELSRKTHKVWVPETLLWRTELSANAKLVYARLARYEGRSGEARPKLRTLARTVGLSRGATQRALKELEDLKLVSSHLRRGQHRPSLFKFLDHPWLHEAIPADEEPEEVDDTEDAENEPEEPDDEAPPKVVSLREIRHVEQPKIAVWEDVPSGPLMDVARPTNGPLELVRGPQMSVARPTNGRREAHEWTSDEEESLKKSQVKRVISACADAHAAVSPATTSKAGDANDSTSTTDDFRPEAQGSAEPYQQLELSMEDDVASDDRFRKLNNLTLKAQVDAARIANEQALKKEKKRRARGDSPKQHIHVRNIELMWRDELEKKFPDLKSGDIGRWYTPKKVMHETSEGDFEAERWSGGKEVGIVQKLIQRFDAERVIAMLRWSIQNWEKIRDRFSKCPQYPTVGWLAALADTLVPEATRTVKAQDVVAEAERWMAEHPEAEVLPPELLARVQSATGGRR